MEDLITVSLVARRESIAAGWAVDWAILDELHSEPMERGRVVPSHTVQGLEAMRIALSAAWRHAKHLHAQMVHRGDLVTVQGRIQPTAEPVPPLS